jgi:hypothetical protein
MIQGVVVRGDAAILCLLAGEANQIRHAEGVKESSQGSQRLEMAATE